MNTQVLRSQLFLRTIIVVVAALLMYSGLHAQPVYQWAKVINNAEWGQSIARDVKGNIYLAGLFASSSDFDPGPGSSVITIDGRNYYFAKYDADGNYLFAFALPVPYSDEIQIAVDQSSNIYLTGALGVPDSATNIDFDPGSGEAFVSVTDGSIFVAKYDSVGNYLWAFSIDSVDDIIYGRQLDGLKSLAVDRFGNIYLTGQFHGTVDFDPSTGSEAKLTSDSFDVYIAKYNTHGKYLWAHKAGGKGDDGALGVVVDNSGSAYITGWTEGYSVFDPNAEGGFLYDSTRNLFFAKYDSSGNFKWVRSIKGRENDNYSGMLALDSTGNIYYSASFDSTTDIDPGPNASYLSNYGTFIGKYSSEGQYMWAKSLGTTAKLNDMEVGISDNIYASGTVRATNYFESGNDSSKVVSISPDVDMFIAKYAPDGKYDWAMHCGSTATAPLQMGCFLESMTIDPSENIYVAGWFGGATDFDPGPGVATITPFLSRDIFFAKYSQVKSAVKSEIPDSPISIYPNPTLGQLHIEGIRSSPDRIEAHIYNVLGSEVLRQTFDAPVGGSMSIDVSKLCAGVYTLELRYGLKAEKIQFVRE
ncbi:MAG: T9SS type A sorting domain-containing protein [Bacteroidota bacterium]|nr:T9SS type A sorting domain-containing protein [Bacteroidota bacterium]